MFLKRGRGRGCNLKMSFRTPRWLSKACYIGRKKVQFYSSLTTTFYLFLVGKLIFKNEKCVYRKFQTTLLQAQIHLQTTYSLNKYESIQVDFWDPQYSIVAFMLKWLFFLNIFYHHYLYNFLYYCFSALFLASLPSR